VNGKHKKEEVGDFSTFYADVRTRTGYTHDELLWVVPWAIVMLEYAAHPPEMGLRGLL
jgi:hypothetical protein